MNESNQMTLTRRGVAVWPVARHDTWKEDAASFLVQHQQQSLDQEQEKEQEEKEQEEKRQWEQRMP